jgi:hypothetical protein
MNNRENEPGVKRRQLIWGLGALSAEAYFGSNIIKKAKKRNELQTKIESNTLNPQNELYLHGPKNRYDGRQKDRQNIKDTEDSIALNGLGATASLVIAAFGYITHELIIDFRK